MNSLLREPDIDVVIAEDAVPQLTAYAVARGWPKALLVMDPNTELAVGRRVALELRQAGILVEELLFGRRLEATEAAVSLVRRHLRARVHPVVVGSGVITDIVRYAAHLEDRDFVSVPTAASMDGYASGVAVLKVDGVKVTYPARPPEAIFADPRVSAAAPPELARSGIGDLLAKATARIDWLAAHLLYGEPFSEEVAARVLRPLSYAAERAAAVISGETDTIRGLLSGLI